MKNEQNPINLPFNLSNKGCASSRVSKPSIALIFIFANQLPIGTHFHKHIMISAHFNNKKPIHEEIQAQLRLKFKVSIEVWFGTLIKQFAGIPKTTRV